MKQLLTMLILFHPITTFSQHRNAIAQYLDGMEKAGFSGVVLIMEEDEVYHADGYGYYDRENEKKFTTRTPLFIASVSKVFISALIKKLIDIGEISYDDKLSKFIAKVPVDKADITVKHLLSHSSGLWLGAISPTSNKGADGFIKELMASKLEFEPGSQVSYSNEGYSLLAYIAEKTTGMSFPDCIRKYIFAPAEMNQAGIVTEIDRWDRSLLPIGYLGDIKQDNILLDPWRPLHYTVQSGVIASVDDLIQFEQALAKGIVLNATVYDEWIKMENTGWWNWYNSDIATEALSHEGYIMPYGFNAMYTKYLEDQITVFVASNEGTNAWSEKIARDLGILLFGGKVFMPPTLRMDNIDTTRDKIYCKDFEIGLTRDPDMVYVNLTNQELINSVMNVDPDRAVLFEKLNHKSKHIIKGYIDDTLSRDEFLSGEQKNKLIKDLGELEKKFGTLENFKVLYSFTHPIAPPEINAVISYLELEFKNFKMNIKIEWENNQYAGSVDIHLLSAGGTGWPLPFSRIPVTGFSKKRMYSYLPSYNKIIYWNYAKD